MWYPLTHLPHLRSHVCAKTRNNYMTRSVFYRKMRLLFQKTVFLDKKRKSTALLRRLANLRGFSSLSSLERWSNLHSFISRKDVPASQYLEKNCPVPSNVFIKDFVRDVGYTQSNPAWKYRNWKLKSLLWGVTRSLFNYLVPMIQDKQAEEAEENEGDRPG
jgi:hypothetical protein